VEHHEKLKKGLILGVQDFSALVPVMKYVVNSFNAVDVSECYNDCQTCIAELELKFINVHM
jgi:hypothetical protein